MGAAGLFKYFKNYKEEKERGPGVEDGVGAGVGAGVGSGVGAGVGAVIE